ncbi:UDP-N-acetylmuramoylalanyl-D-glutamate--2,6-diaminopimelate ligase [Oerskovia sp. Root918]|uniref:UDP-N-acetylmuramoyl-L-alanyl-D-glutamate--2, 6-diaminopimelate ligase n=1 Tax=Oerskovia sp. Root918 TaxID=1736607 RepID=UPI0006F45278|nr:UDP-N-acetylmuramoyl-L-alanyl-D-glutamate--2,6-diaminopimelate ligase [Oerskovia sp. Root918]KRD40487.1 UDP-N-acetylmuramoylalanyl-D-glutamate--2,6-diaminopimelate ligase [Oerskovia sp. Root918]
MTSPIDRLRPTTSAHHSAQDLATTFELTVGTGRTAPDADPGALAGVEIWSVASDNRVAADGDLFVALPGASTHGASFASGAIDRGARAVLTDPHGALLLDEAGEHRVPVLVTDDPRNLLGRVAAWVYGAPAEHLTTFAVTGTNGKTTTTYLIDHVLRALGWKGGLIGTVEMRSGDRVLPSRLTTPEAADLQALLATMREDGVSTLAMEVSSHALAMHRVDGFVFDVAGFTNLSQDHLDFHGDLQEYFDAKAALFTPEHARRGVVVVDDAWGRRMTEAATIPVATLSVADGGVDTDWTVVDVVAEGAAGSAFTLRHRDGRELRTTTALPGGFNVANAALALAMVLEAGADLRDVRAALEVAGGVSAAVPGRMEVVGMAPRVVVDFAHNTDALSLALAALRPTTTGRLHVVFGATGDRDKGKRPRMGAVAVEGADVVVVTDDDPHGEDPAAIRAEVLAGALAALDAAHGATGTAGTAGTPARTVTEVAPRAAAIRDTIREAGPQDTVLIAGRGHEVWQEIAGVDHALDDRVEARAALAERDETTKEHGA